MNNIEHPTHYNWFNIECSDVIKHFDSMSGLAIKYIWRHEHKGRAIEDLRKAVECLQIRIEHLESEEPQETTGPGGETIIAYEAGPTYERFTKRKPKPVIDQRTIDAAQADAASAAVTCPNCAKTASNAPSQAQAVVDPEKIKEALENYIDGR